MCGTNLKYGQNCIISKNSKIGDNVQIGHNCIIEDNVYIGDNAYIDNNTIIRQGTHIGADAFVGSNSILGEYQMDFIRDRKTYHELFIGNNSIIRSGTIIYSGTNIGNNFQTGHRVTIRENALIGNNCSIGTLSDIQGFCKIGNYVNLHSNVHVAQKTVIDDYVWLFPNVVFTNDPTPPSEELVGTHVHSFAIISTHSVILPGIDIGSDSLIAAGSTVTKNVPQYALVAGNPAKRLKDVREIKNHITNEPVYPWRKWFSRKMPWEKSNFENWINSLTDTELEQYNVKEFK